MKKIWSRKLTLLIQMMKWPTEDEEDAESAYGSVGGLAEAYAAGWKAKQQSAAQRKARGYSKPPGKGGKSGKGKTKKGDRGADHRTPDERKKSSKCSSCQQRGHWRGDPECPNVQNGTDPPRSQPGGSSQANYQAGEDGGSPTTHRVNWTFMVDRDPHGWELLQEYESNSDSGSSSEDDRALAEAVLAAPRVEQQKAKMRKYRLALKTVLEALAAESEDDTLKKRLQKKEFSTARDEQARQARKKLPPHAKRDESTRKLPPTPMETDLSPTEVLRILPYMSKEEKKTLLKALRDEQEEEAAKYLDPGRTPEKMKRQDRRNSGYTAGRPGVGRGSVAASSSGGPVAPAAQAESSLPEPVRKKRLEEFSRTLYENALDRKGRVKLSEASEIPAADQDRCEHRYEDLRWGANGAAHWAHCRRCKLRKVLYYSNEHGAMMTTENPVFEAGRAPSWVILETGWRTAVGGLQWHMKFQRELAQKGLKWMEVPHQEVFRFGAGAPVMSNRAVVYPIVLGQSKMSWLRLAVVEDTPTDRRVEQCPALVGPSELARWQVTFNFSDGTLSIGTVTVPMMLSETRHPILEVVGDGWQMDQWETHELLHLRDRLVKDPFSLALMTEALESEGDEEMAEAGEAPWESAL